MSDGIEAPNDNVSDSVENVSDSVENVSDIRHRCFMDGIDWEHHLRADPQGTLLFPNERSLRTEKTCLAGGCGVVEVEVRLIRWVEPQNLKFGPGEWIDGSKNDDCDEGESND